MSTTAPPTQPPGGLAGALRRSWPGWRAWWPGWRRAGWRALLLAPAAACYLLTNALDAWAFGGLTWTGLIVIPVYVALGWFGHKGLGKVRNIERMDDQARQEVADAAKAAAPAMLGLLVTGRGYFLGCGECHQPHVAPNAPSAVMYLAQHEATVHDRPQSVTLGSVVRGHG